MRTNITGIRISSGTSITITARDQLFIRVAMRAPKGCTTIWVTLATRMIVRNELRSKPREVVAQDRANVDLKYVADRPMVQAPMPRTISMGWLRRTSESGSLATSFFSMSLAMAGDSATFRRTSRPTMTSAAEARNGTRQPQETKASSGSWLMARKLTVERVLPTGEPCWANAPYSTDLPLGACSEAIRTEPPHSPPRPMPWIMRMQTRRIGAAMPMEA